MRLPDQLEFAARTDTGLVRTQNEDAIATNPEQGFAVLADGMGGYSAGEVASSIAIQTTCQRIEQGLQALRAAKSDGISSCAERLHGILVDAFQQANVSILEAARAEPLYNGMGTTLVAACFREGCVTVAHVGDSRAYRLRDGALTPLTRDHSLLQEQIDAGLIDPALAPFAQHRNLVTRAVGIGTEMTVEVHDHATHPEDLYLLCSDGLSDMVLDGQIADVLAMQTSSLDATCKNLIDAANGNGGHDNISAILIRLKSPASGASSLFGRIFPWTKSRQA